MLNKFEGNGKSNKNSIEIYNNSKIRSSNFELLRIIAMIMIIIYHIVFHCIICQLTDLKSIERMNNGWFCHPLWYKKMLALEIIMPFGIISNAIFMIIAGYFGINKDNDLKRIEKTEKKLIFQSLFVTIWLVLFSAILYQLNKNDYLSMIDLYHFNNSSWYVGYYFLIILISYIFLNKYLKKFTKQEYLTFLIILFSLLSFSWTKNLMDSFANGLSILSTGIFLYSLGGYIKKYNPFKDFNVFVFIGIIIIANIFLCISFYNTTVNNIDNYNLSDSTKKYVYIFPNFENNNYIIIIISICMFEIFRRIKIKNNRIVNFIGASTFMIYLIHDNAFFYSIWGLTDWITLLYNNPYSFIGKLLLQTLYTFGFGLITYTIYIVIIKIITEIKNKKKTDINIIK